MLLPINNPPISHIPENTNILSILTCDINTYEWIFYNYLFVELCKNYQQFQYESFQHFEGVDHCVFMNTSEINKEVLNYFNISISDFIHQSIENSTYLILPIDMYYIKNYKLFNIRHANHRIMLYGYDESHYYCADFFDHTYSFQKIEKNYILDGFIQLNNDSSMVFPYQYRLKY